MPPISYFKIFFSEKNVFIENDDSYIKQTYRNRCNIYSANGKISLIIPVEASNNINIKDVKIAYNQKWQKEHWRAIESAYNKSAFFLYYRDKFETFYKSPKYKYLIDFNTAILSELLIIFQKPTIIEFTDKFIKEYQSAKDLRIKIHPKSNPISKTSEYFQVFDSTHKFLPDLSIIDYLFNLGNSLTS